MSTSTSSDTCDLVLWRRLELSLSLKRRKSINSEEVCFSWCFLSRVLHPCVCKNFNQCWHPFGAIESIVWSCIEFIKKELDISITNITFNVYSLQSVIVEILLALFTRRLFCSENRSNYVKIQNFIKLKYAINLWSIILIASELWITNELHNITFGGALGSMVSGN